MCSDSHSTYRRVLPWKMQKHQQITCTTYLQQLLPCTHPWLCHFEIFVVGVLGVFLGVFDLGYFTLVVMGNFYMPFLFIFFFVYYFLLLPFLLAVMGHYKTPTLTTLS